MDDLGFSASFSSAATCQGHLKPALLLSFSSFRTTLGASAAFFSAAGAGVGGAAAAVTGGLGVGEVGGFRSSYLRVCTDTSRIRWDGMRGHEARQDEMANEISPQVVGGS